MRVIERCRELALLTEEPGFTTRTFLSEPMHAVHRLVGRWMTEAGLDVNVDAVGNLRGVYPARTPNARRLLIGSHLDTVPRAGAYDGILGVMLGITLVELLEKRPLKFQIEVIGFSEEEGVRFGVPFIGSRALIGDVDEDLLNRRDHHGVTVRQAILDFGLDPLMVLHAEISDVIGYVEFHIEQGPVLESLNLPLAVVDAIVGQSRLEVQFHGRANHAGTTPMQLREDALQGAAEWAGAVEREARETDGLVATVGRLEIQPGAGNVIAGSALASLDVRHADDAVRHAAVGRLLRCAEQIGARRKLRVSVEHRLDQPSVPMDPALSSTLLHAMKTPPHRMNSGAGHDAMIMARRMPTAMLFLRSPGGVSHHPDESVLAEDVAAALETGLAFLREIDHA
jgi:allantoate deiminase